MRTLVLLACALASFAFAQDSTRVNAPKRVQIAWGSTPLVDHERRELVFPGHLLTDDAPTLVGFTYSGCVTICPPSHIMMQQVDAAAPPGWRIVTVTIDPFNDTVTKLAERAEDFASSARWRWLTGKPGHVFDLLDRVGIRFGRVDDHPFGLFLIRNSKTLRINELARAADVIAAGEALK